MEELAWAGEDDDEELDEELDEDFFAFFLALPWDANARGSVWVFLCFRTERPPAMPKAYETELGCLTHACRTIPALIEVSRSGSFRAQLVCKAEGFKSLGFSF